MDALLQASHESIMVDGVEELLQVHLDNPDAAVLDVLGGLRDGLFRSSSLSESIAELREGRVVVLYQHLCDGLLYDSVLNRRYPQHAGTSIRFRNVHSANGARDIPPLPYVFADAFAVSFEVLGEFVDGHPVDPGRSFVFHHPAPCHKQVHRVKNFFQCYHCNSCFRPVRAPLATYLFGLWTMNLQTEIPFPPFGRLYCQTSTYATTVGARSGTLSTHTI